VAKPQKEILQLDGHEVTVTNPEKIYFPKAGISKLQLVEYYLAVADGALRGVARRPMILKRYVNGVEAEPFYQKRVPDKRPAWIDTATFTFPSGRNAVELVVNQRAQLVYVVNLGCVDLNPHAVRSEDMDRPDELRIDLDPVPGVLWPQIVEVGKVVKAVLDDFGLVGWPKTSGSRGAHVWIRIAPEWPFAEVRRAALAFARDREVVEGRTPRRVPRLQPERARPHDRERVLGSPDTRRARVDAAVVGRLLRERPARLHAAHGATAVRGEWRRARRDRRRGRPDREAARARGPRRDRRTVATAFREGGR
jgi:DNA ligase D-like protein (predicted polymerase)